jgi:hypothetical protein
MNKVVIFRFGVDSPLSGDLFAMTAITQGNLEKAVGMPFPGGVLTLVETEFSPSECAEVFRNVAAEHNDVLPIIAFDANSRNGYNFSTLGAIEKIMDTFFKDGLDGVNTLQGRLPDDEDAAEQDDVHSVEANETCELELDELLDLLNEVGSFENLSPAQKQRLEFLTK